MGVFGDIYSGRMGASIQQTIAKAMRDRLLRQSELEQKMRLLEWQRRANLQNALLNTILNLYSRGIEVGVPTESLSGLSNILSRGFAGQLQPSDLASAAQTLVPGFAEAREEELRRKDVQQFRSLATSLFPEVEANKVNEYQAAIDECSKAPNPWECFAAKAPTFNIDQRRLAEEAARLGVDAKRLGLKRQEVATKLDEERLKVARIENDFLPERLRVELENLKKRGAISDAQLKLLEQEWKQKADTHKWNLELLKENVEYRKLVNQEKALQVKILAETAPDRIAASHEELKQLRQKTAVMQLEYEIRQLDKQLKKLGIEDAKTRNNLVKALAPVKLFAAISDLERTNPRAALSVLTQKYEDLIKLGIDEKVLKEYRDALERRARVTDPDRLDGYNLWKEFANTPPPKPEEIDKKLASLRELLVQKGYTEDEARQMAEIVRLRWAGILQDWQLKQSEIALRYATGRRGASATDVLKAVDADRKVLEARERALRNQVSTILTASGASDCIEVNWDTFTFKLLDDGAACREVVAKVAPQLEEALGGLKDVARELNALSTITAQLSGRANVRMPQPEEKPNPEAEAMDLVTKTIQDIVASGTEVTPEELVNIVRKALKNSPYANLADQVDDASLIEYAKTLGVKFKVTQKTKQPGILERLLIPVRTD